MYPCSPHEGTLTHGPRPGASEGLSYSSVKSVGPGIRASCLSTRHIGLVPRQIVLPEPYQSHYHKQNIRIQRLLAQVPDLNDFVAGLKVLLAPAGVVTMEFPHLLMLMEENQFDTIYHEHFSYFSFTTVIKIFEAHGLRLFDVEEIPTHGGSLRIFARHMDDETKPETAASRELLAKEEAFGLLNPQCYDEFSERQADMSDAIDSTAWVRGSDGARDLGPFTRYDHTVGF